MKKLIWMLTISLCSMVLVACTTNSGTDEPLTPERLLQKSKEATDRSLKAVRASISYDDYHVTVYNGDIENPEKDRVKYDMKLEAFLNPLQVKQETHVQPRGVEPWLLESYQRGDRIALRDERKGEEWEEQADATIQKLFGTIVDYAHPTLDLSLFEPFQDQFELRSIPYGYELLLTLDRTQFEELKALLPELGPDEEGFRIVDKLEFAITFNQKTSYVTSFKMSSDVRVFNDGNTYRARQKLNAVYSYFNDIEPFSVPKVIAE